MKIRKNLIYLRKINNITRYKLAKELEVNESLLRKIENGVSKNPRIDTLIKLSSYFEITLDDLVYKDLEK